MVVRLLPRFPFKNHHTSGAQNVRLHRFSRSLLAIRMAVTSVSSARQSSALRTFCPWSVSSGGFCTRTVRPTRATQSAHLPRSVLTGKTNFVSKMGTRAIAAEYDDAHDFLEGLAVIKRHGKWGFIDKSVIVIEPHLKMSHPFSWPASV